VTARNDGPSHIDSTIATAGNPLERVEVESHDENNDDHAAVIIHQMRDQIPAPEVNDHAENTGEPGPVLVINSKFPLKREYRWTAALAIVTLVILAFTDLYAYNASINGNPFRNLLPSSSDNSTFIILLLVQVSNLCLTELINVTLQHLRWSWVSGNRGINILSFLALSPMTSPITILVLVCVRLYVQLRKRRVKNRTRTPISLRTLDQSVAALSIQRY
jgi:hypothetical protein